MRWVHSGLGVHMILVACTTTKSAPMTDAQTHRSDATTIDQLGSDTASRDDAATATGLQGRLSHESTTEGPNTSSPSTYETSPERASDVGTRAPQSEPGVSTAASWSDGNSDAPTSCTSHDDCEADEVCVDSSTRTDCGRGLCTKGTSCGAPIQTVCDPNQPTYTVNDAGEVVPDDRWKGRLCHDCSGLNCAPGACFRCVSPP
jgi:hypothetical protein